MLEVEIKVNGRVIHRITAINRGQPSRPPGPEGDWRCYELNHADEDADYGECLWHRRSEGAVALAAAMLDAVPMDRKTIPSDTEEAIGLSPAPKPTEEDNEA